VAELLDGRWTLQDLGEQELRGQQRQRVFAVESVPGQHACRQQALKES
jgi:hypothetical protein